MADYGKLLFAFAGTSFVGDACVVFSVLLLLVVCFCSFGFYKIMYNEKADKDTGSEGRGDRRA